MKKILVSGNRDWTSTNFVLRVLKKCLAKYGEFHLIHGDCRGADTIAGAVATKQLELMTTAVPAKWKTGTSGKGEGPKRNIRMLDLWSPDLVICFHENIANSTGTRHMLNVAKQRSIPVLLLRGDENEIILPDLVDVSGK